MSLPKWKAQQTPKVAKAETQLFIAFREAGLNKRMVTQQSIILVNTDRDPPEKFGTIPDFTWHFDGHDKVLYLDGPHHLRNHVACRDVQIDRFLKEQKGIESLRISYSGKLPGKQKKKIVDEVHAWLKIY